MRDLFKYKKNCPFCDSKVEIDSAEYVFNVYNELRFKCPKCGVISLWPNIEKEDKKDFIDAYFDVWQNRPDDEDDHK